MPTERDAFFLHDDALFSHDDVLCKTDETSFFVKKRVYTEGSFFTLIFAPCSKCTSIKRTKKPLFRSIGTQLFNKY